MVAGVRAALRALAGREIAGVRPHRAGGGRRVLPAVPGSGHRAPIPASDRGRRRIEPPLGSARLPAWTGPGRSPGGPVGRSLSAPSATPQRSLGHNPCSPSRGPPDARWCRHGADRPSGRRTRPAEPARSALGGRPRPAVGSAGDPGGQPAAAARGRPASRRTAGHCPAGPAATPAARRSAWTRPWPALGPAAAARPLPGPGRRAAGHGRGGRARGRGAAGAGRGRPAGRAGAGLVARLDGAAVLVDLAVHRLPDRLTLPAAAGTWLLLGVAALAGAGAGPLAAGRRRRRGTRRCSSPPPRCCSAAGASGSATPSWRSAWARCSAGTAGQCCCSGCSSRSGCPRWSAWDCWSPDGPAGRSHLPFGPFLLLGTAVRPSPGRLTPPGSGRSGVAVPGIGAFTGVLLPTTTP